MNIWSELHKQAYYSRNAFNCQECCRSLYCRGDIFLLKRNEVETTMITETAEVLKVNNIDMRALLIRSIILPDGIKKQ